MILIGRSTSTTTNITTLSTTLTTTNQAIPYMRPKPIMVELFGMKPFTTLHAFIDLQNIDAYLSHCLAITITGEVGKFLGYKDVSPTNTVINNRTIVLQDNYYTGFSHPSSFDKGELIQMVNPASGGSAQTVVTAVVVSREVQINPVTRTTETVLYVVLPRQYALTAYGTYIGTGTFLPTKAITGLSSGATATISSVTQITSAQTNSNGNWFGYFILPKYSFLTGSHDVLFTDNPIGDMATSQTSAAGTYSSRGGLTINTTNIVKRLNTTILNTTTYRDPLAQTFIIPADKKNGVYVTSVDIFFSIKSLGETQPVDVQICEVDNGNPTNRIVKNATSAVQAVDIATSTNASVGTKFKFAGPVYLESGKEYCIKVLSNSVGYKIFIAQMGQAWIQDPTKLVAAQPHLGVLFKSQNNSTWTPDQMQDMMFRLNYAVFDTSKSGTVTLNNAAQGSAREKLTPNPFTTYVGSNSAKVFQANHGLSLGNYVQFSGSTNAAFNSTFAVSKVINSDLYLITLAANATSTQADGGSAVMATKNIEYDLIRLETGNDVALRAGADFTATIRQAGATGLDASSSVVQDTVFLDNTSAKYIHSDLNESLLLSGARSLTTTLNIFSSDPSVSPVINRNNLQVVMASNRVNSPSVSDNLANDKIVLTSALAGVTFTATTNVIGIPTTTDISKVQVGAIIDITGTTSNNFTGVKILDLDKTVSPYAVYVDRALVTEAAASTTINQYQNYVDEIAPFNGTSSAKYQTKKIILKTPASAIKLMMAAAIPAECEVQAYYRTGLSSSSLDLSMQRWVSIPMTYRKSQGTEYIDQEYTINAIANFTTVQVKLVMTSTSTSSVPKIKSLRVICLA